MYDSLKTCLKHRGGQRFLPAELRGWCPREWDHTRSFASTSSWWSSEGEQLVWWSLKGTFSSSFSSSSSSLGQLLAQLELEHCLFDKNEWLTESAPFYISGQEWITLFYLHFYQAGQIWPDGFVTAGNNNTNTIEEGSFCCGQAFFIPTPKNQRPVKWKQYHALLALGCNATDWVAKKNGKNRFG